jgi:hypothetical protein
MTAFFALSNSREGVENVKKSILVFVLAIMVLAGCGAVSQDTLLAFEVHLRVSEAGDAKISLGLHNASAETFPGDDVFNAVMELRDEEGMLAARVHVGALDPVEPGDTAFSAGWEGKLEPGSYRLTWGAADYGSLTAEFPIVANEWTFLHINQGVQSAQTR